VDADEVREVVNESVNMGGPWVIGSLPSPLPTILLSEDREGVEDRLQLLYLNIIDLYYYRSYHDPT